MTPEDIAELRRVAEAASPGPWEYVKALTAAGDEREGYGTVQIKDCPEGFFDRIVSSTDELWVVQFETDEDAEFIATFDPATVSTLLGRITELEEQQ